MCACACVFVCVLNHSPTHSLTRSLTAGQKARVSIARAILASRRAEVILMDDPFSAVDGATGNWIFEHGVLGELKGA